jgi:hypothetical protein
MQPVRAPGADYMARLHWRLRQRLPAWVVYRPVTREYPSRWVARMHVTVPEPKPTRFVITHDTLEELRSLLPEGLARLAHDPLDPPEIEEVWI